MAKFKCKVCNSNVREISKHTIKVVDGEVVCPEAVCCDEYMESIREEGKGFGGIIKRPGGTVSKKF